MRILFQILEKLIRDWWRDLNELDSSAFLINRNNFFVN